MLPSLTVRVGHGTPVINGGLPFRIVFLSQFDSFRFWITVICHDDSDLYLGFVANTAYTSKYEIFTVLNVYNFNLDELFLMVLVVALYVAVDQVDYLLIIYKAWLEI